MSRFDLTDAAIRDIAAIADRTEASWGVDQAQRYLDMLELRLTQLAAGPGLGRARDELAPGVRSALFESHILYYRVSRRGIVVLRVLHERQDPLHRIE